MAVGWGLSHHLKKQHGPIANKASGIKKESEQYYEKTQRLLYGHKF